MTLFLQLCWWFGFNGIFLQHQKTIGHGKSWVAEGRMDHTVHLPRR